MKRWNAKDGKTAAQPYTPIESKSSNPPYNSRWIFLSNFSMAAGTPPTRRSNFFRER